MIPDRHEFNYQQALAKWQSIESAPNALGVVNATGLLRVFAPGIPERPSRLSPRCGLLAACNLHELLGKDRGISVPRLPPQPDSPVCSALKLRTDTWATVLALIELESELRDHQLPTARQLHEMLQKLFPLLQRDDDNLEVHLLGIPRAEYRTAAVEIRQQLSPEFQQTPPWWLDVK